MRGRPRTSLVVVTRHPADAEGKARQCCAVHLFAADEREDSRHGAVDRGDGRDQRRLQREPSTSLVSSRRPWGVLRS